MLTPYLIIGEILRPQGLKGEVKVRPITQDESRFLDLDHVLLLREGAYVPHAVQCTRLHQGLVYLRFEGVNDRDGAETLRGQLIYVDRGHALKLPEDQHFIVDLIGLEVVDTQGNPLGRLAEILTPGGNDVYVVRGPRGEILMPALKALVLDIDLERGRILVDAQRLTEMAVFEDSPQA